MQDVPSPIDLRVMSDAREWEATALVKRPVRPEFFARFAAEIMWAPHRVHRVLELGSGPGFLAEHLLQTTEISTYVALDFSPAMHELAAERLGPLCAKVAFVQRSFRDADWLADLGLFDCIVTHQAVHEVRHKRHVKAVHEEARQHLAPGGMYLMCDHFCGGEGIQNDQLYMTVEEQATALREAGFASIELLLRKSSLALHRARLS